jgi:hypothetical protein
LALLPLRITDPGRFFVVPIHLLEPHERRRAMNTTLETPLMSATQTPTPPILHVTPTHGTHGEGVNEVALFESRRLRVARAWDELSEIDRQVLLESVRQRRKYQAHKTRIYTELYGMRVNK